MNIDIPWFILIPLLLLAAIVYIPAKIIAFAINHLDKKRQYLITWHKVGGWLLIPIQLVLDLISKVKGVLTMDGD
jgi:phage-related holin